MGTAQANASFSVSRESAIRFIVILGTISLLADVTYEGNVTRIDAAKKRLTEGSA